MRYILAAGLSAAALAIAGSASALVWTSDLEYRDVGTTTPGHFSPSFGQVRIEDGLDFGKTVQVTVTLTNPNSLFVNTGGPHDPFLYNLLHTADVEVINSLVDGKMQNFYDGGRTSPAAFEATPFGEFTNKIGCCSTWIEDQDVVSGFHFENQTTTKQVLVGYQIASYEIKGYEISGYEQKRDNKGNLVFDKKTGQPVYDTSKPIYDLNKPIYNYNKPIYDYSKPIYQTQTTVTKVKVLDYTHIPAHWQENNGSANGIKGPLTFFLHDADGLTFAGQDFVKDSVTGRLITPGAGDDNHFFSNRGGWWFTADICDANVTNGGACTYNVGAKDAFTSVAVPEPATWALMITGFGLAGAVLRRRGLRLTA